MFGYRPGDVDAAFAELEERRAECRAALERRAGELERAGARIAELDRICDHLSDRVVGRERELERLRAELARLHAEGEGKLAALATLAEELAAVRAAARGQATRIRLRALRDAAELSGRITELTQRPAESRERLLDGLQEAIARIGAADDVATLAEEADRHNGDVPAERDQVGEDRSEQEGMFAGMVEVEVGPLADFSQLVGFEDAAGAIGATSEISVTRFAQGRATLEMKLAEPVELLRELEQRMPFGFRVRDQRSDRLVLDVDAA